MSIISHMSIMWDIPYPFIPTIKLKGKKKEAKLFLSPYSHDTLLSSPSFFHLLLSSHPFLIFCITHAHFIRKRVSEQLEERVLSEGEEEKEEEEEKRKKRVSGNSV